MTEYPAHKRAKRRVFELLLSQFPKFDEVAMEKVMNFGKNGYFYICDIWALRQDRYYFSESDNKNHWLYNALDIELDGQQSGGGHSGRIAQRKNKERDRAFAEHGITTIRFDTSSIIGKKAVPDQTILDEIAFHLKQKEALA